MIFLKVICVIIACYVKASQSVLISEVDNYVIQCPDPSNATLLLAKDIIHESGQVKTVMFPSTGINTVPINCILTRDLGDGGYAMIIDGGLNQYFVELQFEARSGTELNFEYEIYGEAPPTPTPHDNE